MTDQLPLTAKTIVVTRPEKQSTAISQRLVALGATVVKFPLIAIEPPANQSQYLAQLSQLATYDYLIFTSVNSVENTAIPKLPDAIKIAAVGKKTAQALEALGYVASIVPSEFFNSEALLEHQRLQTVKGQRIAIIRGEGGRDLLKETLVERGAEVDYIDVYRRVCPVDSLLPLVKHQVQGNIEIIMLTSVEGLNNLFSLDGYQTQLKNTLLLLGSRRINDALDASWPEAQVLIAKDPTDDQMVSCLLDWASNVNARGNS